MKLRCRKKRKDKEISGKDGDKGRDTHNQTLAPHEIQIK